MSDLFTDDCPDQEPAPKYPAQARWRKKNPMKRWAHVATASALKRGLIIRQPCEVCGAADVDAHHDDHNQPLKVRWLCRRHHKDLHKAEKEEAV